MLDNRPPLTDPQRTTVEFARRDLTDARAADLATLPAASLILLIERLRSSLDDILSVIEETAPL
ncbi:hypothetical protein [Streptomyces sp. BE230]|uniref:hypothetical protein n=1 Tax=Streptomyces sp. BE230 TaxID=3002526 RepID=UPI002ED5EEC7|nr:hypothetical protein [Streptomyces sp. BE230]